MMSKLRPAGSFAALGALALAVGCRGFFVKPVLSSISISPSAPSVSVGKTLQLQVFGTYDDGSRSQVRSGVSWSSSDTTIATADGGLLTGIATGSSTITADAQGVSSTATATVVLSGVSSIVVSPSSNSVTAGSGSPAIYRAKATAGGTSVDITGSATWTLTPTPATNTVTCTFVDPDEQCSAAAGSTTQVYTITVSYPGTNVVGTATLTVQ
jgi:hypothetical protein